MLNCDVCVSTRIYVAFIFTISVNAGCLPTQSCTHTHALAHATTHRAQKPSLQSSVPLCWIRWSASQTSSLHASHPSHSSSSSNSSRWLFLFRLCVILLIATSIVRQSVPPDQLLTQSHMHVSPDTQANPSTPPRSHSNPKARRSPSPQKRSGSSTGPSPAKAAAGILSTGGCALFCLFSAHADTRTHILEKRHP